MAETEGNAHRDTRKARILRIVLIVSLSLNLLVLGVLAGGMMKSGRLDRVGSAADLRALWLALPETAQRDLHGAVGPRTPDGERVTREDRRARAAARHAEILTLLRAQTFDAEAFAAVLQAEHAERSERIGRAHQAFVARVADLSAAERAAVAERLEERRGRRFPGR